MVRQIILSQCGIQFDGNALKAMDIPLPTVSFGNPNPTANYRFDYEFINVLQLDSDFAFFLIVPR